MKTLSQVESVGGYKILYADPPWSYRNGGRGAARNHYNTLPDENLARLPVERLAAKDSVLFMWGTWPTLPTNLATMRSWGFEYKTLAFLWVKTNAKAGTPFWGGGFWTRSNSEFCLLGVRGDIHRIDAGVHQLVETWEEKDDLVLRAPAKDHSTKPGEVRERILKLMGDLPAIELFAREKDPKWDSWGDEIESDVVLEEVGQELDRQRKNENINANEHEKGDENMARLPEEYAEGAGKARVAGGGNFIQHGDYILMIKNCTFQKVQDSCLITEFLVVDAKKKVVYQGTTPVEQEPNKIGSECSEVVNYDGAGKLSAHGNARALVLGLFGFENAKIADEVIAKTLVGMTNDINDPKIGLPQQAMCMFVACSTFPKEIRSRPGEFITGRKWTCVDKPGEGLNAADKVAARKAAFARSAEECVKLAQRQIAETRGTTTGTTVSEAVAPEIPSVPSPKRTPYDDGWKDHPKHPEWMYRGQETKLKTELFGN